MFCVCLSVFKMSRCQLNDWQLRERVVETSLKSADYVVRPKELTKWVMSPSAGLFLAFTLPY